MGHSNKSKQTDQGRTVFGWPYVIGRAARAVLTVILLSLLIFLLLYADRASALQYGDLNDNGRIDVQDVVLVMKHALGMEYLSASKEVLADVNGDGFVNVQDASLIMQKTLGLLNDFPVISGSGFHLVEKVIIADGISPGLKIVIVLLKVPDPENYRVEIKGVSLNFSDELEAFVSEVKESDAVKDKVAVYGL